MDKFISKRIRSFGYAFKGIARLIGKEPNAWIHCVAVVVVTCCGLYFGISSTEWCIIVLCFALVLAAEGFNTAIERLTDLVSPHYHPLAGEAKDVAAGAVLICAIASAIVGCIVFLPYFLEI